MRCIKIVGYVVDGTADHAPALQKLLREGNQPRLLPAPARTAQHDAAAEVGDALAREGGMAVDADKLAGAEADIDLVLAWFVFARARHA